MLDDEVKKTSSEDQKVADEMMNELEALMKPGTVYMSFSCLAYSWLRAVNLMCYIRELVTSKRN